MANFFKDYQAQIRERKQAEQRAEQDKRQSERMRRDYLDGLKVGQKVRYSFLIDTATGKPIIYTGYLTSNDSESDYIWVADTKEHAKQGRGATVRKSAVIIPA